MKKVSLIVTVLNEEKTIVFLLESVVKQTLLPNEMIIVDGGSVDKTVTLVKNFIKNKGNFQKFPIKIFIKKGNRSVGRNHAISKAKNDWVAITDAGCIPDRNWLKELVKKQEASGAKVVAGYYKAVDKLVGKTQLTSFQKAVIPYVLVMPNRVNENDFLPATRSVLLSKKVWQKVGKFDERLSDNEDYAFAKKLVNYLSDSSGDYDSKVGVSKTSKKIQGELRSKRGCPGVKIAFAKDAVVAWMPVSSLKSFTKMIFRFARGDVFAGIIRPKVLLIFLRYLFGFSLFIWGVIKWPMLVGFWILFGLIPVLLLIYILWSIVKNLSYVPRNWYWFPVLQVVSDLAVMWGSACGLVKRK